MTTVGKVIQGASNEVRPVQTVTPGTPILEVLKLLIKNDISAIPICDEEGHVVDIFAKYDVMVSLYISFEICSLIIQL